ncbi:MAG TPA: hypothetical protein VF956_06730 [Candidatus Dormibacteraeota bacterium]
MLAPLLVAAAVAFPVTAIADASTYRQAVEDTLTIVTSAKAGDVAAAQRAIAVLEAGTGQSQLEIIADLQMRPPDFQDAGVRLTRLRDVLAAPAGTADPAQAQQQLHQVLSMKRYNQLNQPPGPLDRLGQWIQDRIRDILNLLFGGTGRAATGIPLVYFYILGAIAVAVAAVVIFRSTRGRLAEGAGAGASFGPRAPADFFAEADRLAAAGDRVGAIRALCAGVAGTIAGEHTWAGSPLTVREIFSRTNDSARLRPLLLPFEAAVYGGRDVDAATYARAELAAAPFRTPAQEAAA